MLDRIFQMFVKEITQVLRDPRMRGIIFVAPVVQLIVLSYAVTTEVKNIRIAVVDQDGTPESRDIASRFAGSEYFHIVGWVGSGIDAQGMVDREEIQGFIGILPGFAQALRAGRSAPLQIVVDGTDSSTARVIIEYSADIVEQCSSKILVQQFERSTGRRLEPDRVSLESRAWYNVNLESRPFYIPGMLGLMVGLITIMLTSMAVVREREIGTLEQLMVTPITPFELIIGKTVPFACISFIVLCTVLCVTVFWFGIPIKGSLWLLLGASMLYIGCMLGIGLLISTTSRSQQQATLTNVLFFMPCILLSGFFFPIDNMPRVVQWITLANPMRYFVFIARNLFLKATGLDILWPQMLALALLGIVALGIASLTFRKTMA